MIRLEKSDNRVAIVYLDNPPLNVLTLNMTEQIIRLFDEIESDDNIRAVIITGAGEKAFCAGADIHEFAAVRNNVTEKKLRKENEAFLKIERLSKPVIAAIDGIALGGGCEMALACDIRIMAKNVKIGLPEIRLGVFPGTGGLYRLPAIIGISRAMEMMYTGEPITAEEAERIGLINHVTEEKQVLTFSKKLAEKIAQQPKLSLAAIKAGVRKSIEITQEEAIRYNLELSDAVFKSADCEEGVNAFFEKRKPRFL